MTASVLDADVSKQLSIIRRLAGALKTASISLHASFTPDDGNLALSHRSAEDTAAVLADVGGTLATAVEELASAVEIQLVEFLEFVRRDNNLSLVGLCNKCSIAPEKLNLMDPQSNLQQKTEVAASAAMGKSTRRPGESEASHNAVEMSLSTDRRAASTLLQSCLFLMIESVLTQVNATCGAVYMGESAEKSYTFHRVAHIHADGKLPVEFCRVNTSLLVTVVQKGMAINFDNTQAFCKASEDDMETKHNFLNGHDKHLLHLRTGLILPIGKYGCVVVADKSIGVPQIFTPFDEHLVWSFAILCEGLFSRYFSGLFLGMKWTPSTGLLHQFTRFPSIPNVTRSSSHSCDTSMFLLNNLISTPQKMTVFRARHTNLGAAWHQKGAKKSQLTVENLFQDAAEHISSIESFLLDSAHELNILQQKNSDYVRSLEEKQSRIAALERELRRVGAQSLFKEKKTSL